MQQLPYSLEDLHSHMTCWPRDTLCPDPRGPLPRSKRNSTYRPGEIRPIRSPIGPLSFPKTGDNAMISPCLDRPLVSHLERFRGLIQPGIVGNFTHCEFTEILANVEGVSGPQNVFTLAVLEERDIA